MSTLFCRYLKLYVKYWHCRYVEMEWEPWECKFRPRELEFWPEEMIMTDMCFYVKALCLTNICNCKWPTIFLMPDFQQIWTTRTLCWWSLPISLHFLDILSHKCFAGAASRTTVQSERHLRRLQILSPLIESELQLTVILTL